MALCWGGGAATHVHIIAAAARSYSPLPSDACVPPCLTRPAVHVPLALTCPAASRPLPSPQLRSKQGKAVLAGIDEGTTWGYVWKA